MVSLAMQNRRAPSGVVNSIRLNAFFLAGALQRTAIFASFRSPDTIKERKLDELEVFKSSPARQHRR
jgi:hypothetical protein